MKGTTHTFTDMRVIQSWNVPLQAEKTWETLLDLYRSAFLRNTLQTRSADSCRTTTNCQLFNKIRFLSEDICIVLNIAARLLLCHGAGRGSHGQRSGRAECVVCAIGDAQAMHPQA
ncbi:hypothetical protein [Vandammella animalimorsus]|uniref:hypothetical protein n=1 Tax=Vandammella animalimorsus TaxID=2029117 RepID=UPI0011780E16|nr:hypothetical protein [Vandammella animalimorsus]